MSLYSLVLFSMFFWMVSIGIKFEEAKMIFLHGLKALECSGHLQVSSLVLKNTQNLNQVIKISGQLFVVLLHGFVVFLCDQLQAWILNKWESVFENGRSFLFITYTKKNLSQCLHNSYYLGVTCGTLKPMFHNFAKPELLTRF